MTAPMVRIKLEASTGSGRRRGWLKLVTAVDTSKKDGYAFAGEFLRDGTQDIPVGSIIVEQYPSGSVRNGTDKGDAMRVQADGTLLSFAKTENWRKDFLDFRDAVGAALAKDTLKTSRLDVLAQERRALLERIAEIDRLMEALTMELTTPLV